MALELESAVPAVLTVQLPPTPWAFNASCTVN